MSLTKHIPEVGEMGSADGIPAKLQMAHITVGAATTNDVVVGDTNTYTLLGVTEPIMVKHIFTQVAEAFTASVTLDIGDTGSLTRFTTDTTISPPATGAVLVADTGLTVPYVYSAAQDITIDVNGATVAAGLLNVYVEYYRLVD